MFERFTGDARTVVASAIDVSTTLDADEVRPVHLLLALSGDDTGAGQVLAAHGLTEDAVSAATGVPPAPPPTPLRDDDAAALRSLGIDLEAIREAVDAQFGEGALDAAASSPEEDDRSAPPGAGHDTDRSRPRLAPVGRVRLARGAKKVLELALREAVREHSRQIRSEHLALAVLRTDDEAVRMVLATVGVDVGALRGDLEARARRSA